MNLGFGASAGGGVGFDTTADGFVTIVFGGAAGFGGSTGRGGAAGACGSFCCVTAFNTSPGLEIFDRSIFGRNS